MATSAPSDETRRPTNVSLPAGLVQEARAMGINLSQACEAGLRRQLAEARDRLWQEENRAAIAASNAYLETHGLPLAEYRMF